ncbi:MAG: glycoside hydrolase family 97 catalytic domain-containing protein [Bacteroidetes bacterium]|nr:glycoside hydrolase family 97 catalytic domain-containing protein [Bacteroidota bacterium]
MISLLLVVWGLMGNPVSVAMGASAGKPVQLVSPGKGYRVEIGEDGEGGVGYRMWARDSVVVGWSPLGLDGDVVGGVSATKPVLRSSRFLWPLGEDSVIDNTYNEFVVSLKGVKTRLEVRLYDGALAFRYLASGNIRRELTGFNLPGPYTIYQYNQESVFTPTAVDTMRKTCDLPATLTDGRYYISIGEADNEGYTKAELAAGGGGLRVVYPRDTLVRVSGATPWRTIGVARSAVGLHDFSQLYLKLVPGGIVRGPVPGKLIRSALTTQAGMDCIDFAAAHHFSYILYDAGWYGSEWRGASDPRTPIAAIDMPAVIRYGKEKGIGVLLYVNYIGLRAHLDSLLPLYKSWGVSGMKFGFVDGLTQDGLSWLTEAIQKVNDYGFVLDIHDNYKPTGLSRKWPALLTQEGIRGDENSPDAWHTTVLPFTRLLAGPADFTFCYPNPKNTFSKNLKVSKAQQMALTVVYFSPLQSIFWYGKPNDYTDESDIAFFSLVPTVWSESRYLSGEIGQYISVARRAGSVWFVGNAAGPSGWEGSIKLDFLQPGRVYSATVFEDDGKGGISKRTVKLRKGDRFDLHIAAAGGQAMILR